RDVARGTGSCGMNGVNLLPEPMLIARKCRRRRTIWTRWLLTYSVVLLAGVLAFGGVLIEPVEALQARSLGLDSDLVATEAQIALSREREQKLISEVQVLSEIHGQPDWSVLLVHLGEHLGPDVTIQSVRVGLTAGSGSLTPGQLARGPYAVNISGVAREQSDVTAYVLRLENEGLLGRITLQGTSPTRSGDQSAVQFTLDAVVGEGEDS
ncbi:MAG: PilN domain-containing protein, partial [Planctomycetota bacterium]